MHTAQHGSTPLQKKPPPLCQHASPPPTALLSAPQTKNKRTNKTKPTNPQNQTQNIPVADAKPDDIADLLGGALFKALFKWFTESGPVYLLPTGPVSSFLVISDPECAKHVLRASDNSTR